MVKKYESPKMVTVEIKQSNVLMAGSNGKCGFADYGETPIPSCSENTCSSDGCPKDEGEVW